LLLILLPAVLAAELAAAAGGWWRRAGWLLRLVVAGGAGRVLLHNSTYLADWSVGQCWLVLGAMAALLAGVWFSLPFLGRKPTAVVSPPQNQQENGGRKDAPPMFKVSLVLAVALTAGGAGLTVMLSRYATGGQIGLPLAAALMGASAVALILPHRPDGVGPLGLGLVGLFSLVVIGRFFGELSTTFALVLFLAPLLCWLPELIPTTKVRPLLRGLGRVVFPAVPVAVVAALAAQKFQDEDSAPPPAPPAPVVPAIPGIPEPTPQDYEDFKK
jgi:hypothetical protein